MSETPAPPPRPARPHGQWASPTRQLHVSGGAGGDAAAVEGRQLVGPLQGFGKMWQKTYAVRLEGAAASPSEVVTVWKSHFGAFWPSNTRMHTPLAGITPGEVALISGRVPGGLTLSTGVYVIYADEVSFSYMCPEGHPFAGMITFSAEGRSGVTVAQIQLFIRAYDPLVEVGMALGGHRLEDEAWIHMLRALAGHFGVADAEVSRRTVCVDEKRRWEHFRNWRKSSALYPLKRPFRRRPAVVASPGTDSPTSGGHATTADDGPETGGS